MEVKRQGKHTIVIEMSDLAAEAIMFAIEYSNTQSRTLLSLAQELRRQTQEEE